MAGLQATRFARRAGGAEVADRILSKNDGPVILHPLAVQLAARVMSHAGPGQIMATGTVVQATAGAAELKGIPEPWKLFELAG